MSSPRPILAAALAFAAAAQPHAHHTMSPTMAFFFHLGIAGLFLVALVDSSFVPLPIPGLTDILLIIYAAAHENPFLLVAIAVAGASAGGLIGHAAGRAGGMAFLRKHVPERILSRITRWVEEHALLAVALPALLPPPMPLTPFVLVAGAVRMSRKKFAIAFTLSRLARYSLSVWLGVHYGRSVLRLWSHFSARWGTTFLIALWVFIGVFLAIAIWKLWKTSRAIGPKAAEPVAT
jgi:membrane protein YqaA with SNARE-associated domain